MAPVSLLNPLMQEESLPPAAGLSQTTRHPLHRGHFGSIDAAVYGQCAAGGAALVRGREVNRRPLTPSERRRADGLLSAISRH
jgi:hypothetical protein